MDYKEAKILMTTNRPKTGHTILKMERLTANQLDENGAIHVGGGDNKGIIINRPGVTVKSDLDGKAAQLSLSFKVFLVNSTVTAANVHVEEFRTLKFWFEDGINEDEQLMTAQDFFRDLVNPCDFPRDYVGFIMKVIKLLQRQYLTIRQVQLEMKQSEEKCDLPSRPNVTKSLIVLDKLDGHLNANSIPIPELILSKNDSTAANSEINAEHGSQVDSNSIDGKVSVDETALGSNVEVTQAKVLEIIESSYPNAVTLEEIVKATNSNEEEVSFHVQDLTSKNIIKRMENMGFMRVAQNDTQVKMVKQMPKVQKSQQPTIAIITAQYCEKLAVDSMIDNKDTYVKYKTEGGSNVYTLGTIGWHRVVSTKLPALGHSRGAMIAAGNTTTRLLGTFQHVDYVFLVGIGGGVAHYTDFSKHVRLGDVVVSSPPTNSPTQKPYIYLHCEKTKNSSEENNSSSNGGTHDDGDLSTDGVSFRTWCPTSLELQELGQTLWKDGLKDEVKRTWESNLSEGLEILKNQESDFNRPAAETDKLYMNLGAKDVLEVIHPEVPEGAHDPRNKGMPMVHFGAIASGRMALKDEKTRQDIAHKFGVAAFDSEFDTVVESIHGNRKDKYIFIRGVCDYKDGTRKKDWAPFASLAAAAFMKSMIMSLSPMADE